MIDKNFTYAIVGASNNPDKYGNKVLLDLKNSGYKVVPINPKETEIAGLKAHQKLSQFEGKFDVVVFVVPPNVTELVLEEVLKLGIKNIWMQPGSESSKAVSFCEKHKINHIYNACIMVNRK